MIARLNIAEKHFVVPLVTVLMAAAGVCVIFCLSLLAVMLFLLLFGFMNLAAGPLPNDQLGPMVYFTVGWSVIVMIGATAFRILTAFEGEQGTEQDLLVFGAALPIPLFFYLSLLLWSRWDPSIFVPAEGVPHLWSYTLDLVSKSVCFDVFEHFGVSLSRSQHNLDNTAFSAYTFGFRTFCTFIFIVGAFDAVRQFRKGFGE